MAVGPAPAQRVEARPNRERRGRPLPGARGSETAAELEPSRYAAWFRGVLGRRVWSDELRALGRVMGDLDGRTVLDVGAGDGRLAGELASRGADVMALDRSPAMLEAGGSRGGPGLKRVRADGMELPFADGSFDVTVAVTVLCFANPAGRLVAELARVTRPGGRVVLGELGRWSLWAVGRRVRGWLKGGLWADARFRTASELRELLRQAGVRDPVLRGAVYYPRSAVAARLFGAADRWLAGRTTVGAAFLAVAGAKDPGNDARSPGAITTPAPTGV